MNNPKTTRRRKTIQQKENLTCKRCKKQWEVGWVSANSGDGIEHPLTCDCGKVLKKVRTAPEGPPVMILQHSYDKTISACLPAAVAGALFPIIPESFLLAAYGLSCIACGATFVNEDNLSVSSLGGIAIWSLLLISGAAAIGALLGHALWWWWQ